MSIHTFPKQARSTKNTVALLVLAAVLVLLLIYIIPQIGELANNDGVQGITPSSVQSGNPQP